MVLNLIIQNDSVGFIWRQPGQAHGARWGRHQVNCRHCRRSYTGQNKKTRKIRFIYLFLYYVFSSYMPFVCPQKPKYKVLGCGLCEKLWSIVSMQTHSPLMLKFSLPEDSGRERGCLILLWQEKNQTAKLMDKFLVHAVPSAIHKVQAILETSTQIQMKTFHTLNRMIALFNLLCIHVLLPYKQYTNRHVCIGHKLTEEHKIQRYSTHLRFSCFVHMCLLMA